VCGQVVGTTDNQFRQYTYNISQALGNCKGDPTLELNFGSAPEIANAIAHDPDSERMHHPCARQLTFLSLLTPLRVAGRPTAGLRIPEPVVHPQRAV
jgi:hypothetical protein